MGPKPTPKPDEPAPEGFAVIPGTDQIVAVHDVEIEYYPRGCKTPSRSLFAPAGSVLTRAAYAKRMATYQRYSRYEVK